MLTCKYLILIEWYIIDKNLWERIINILVLNGSPKGDYSITLQTTNTLKAKSKHNIEILHVGHKIKALESVIKPSK